MQLQFILLQLTIFFCYYQSNDCTKDQNFIHNLTKVVIDHCCEEYPASATQPSQLSYRLQNTRLENLSQLLQRYINNESQLELQCINALQHFANAREYPSGKLIYCIYQSFNFT